VLELAFITLKVIVATLLSLLLKKFSVCPDTVPMSDRETGFAKCELI
jgi:hypothetical protein